MSVLSVQGEQSTSSEIAVTTALNNLATSGAGEFIQKIGASSFANGTPAGSGANTALSNLASVAINTALLLGTSDGAALGSVTKMWSDLFLASGAVINFNAGNMTLTHAAGSLTFAGGNVLGLGAATATSLATTAVTPLLLTNGQLVNITLTSQTVGATTLTIPNFASVSDSFAFITLAQTLTNKDISSSTNTYRAASLTVVGGVELATTAEINTGTDTTRAIPVDQYVASNRNVRYFLIRCIDSATDWSADGTLKVGGDVELPFTGTITEIGGYVDTAGTTGTAIVDVNLNGTTLMTTNKLSWDSTEKSTRTAATAPTLTTTAVTAGDIITVDIDTNHTTKSKGLTVRIGIRIT